MLSGLEYLTDEQIRKGKAFILTEDDFLTPSTTGPGQIYNADGYWGAVSCFYWFFCQEFVTITDKNRQTVPFIFNNPQRLVELRSMQQVERYGVIHMWVLKPRQIGMSLLCAVRGVWASFFYGMLSTIYAAEKDEQAMQLIFPYARQALRQIQHKAKKGSFPYPELLELDVDRATRFEFKDVEFLGEMLTGRGRVRVAKAEPGAVGEQCGMMQVTEFSRVARPGAFWDAAYNSIPPIQFFSIYYVESTALHTGPMFYKEFMQRYEEEERTGIPPVSCATFVPSYIHHEYRWPTELVAEYSWRQFWAEKDDNLYGDDEYELVNKEWLDPFTGKYEKLGLGWWMYRRHQIANQMIPDGSPFTKRQIFDQSFPMDPASAGLLATRSVFPPAVIKRREEMTCAPWMVGDLKFGADNTPEFVPSPAGKLNVWQRPLPNEKYIVAFDVAGGVRGDHSVGVSWHPGAKQIPAAWRSNIIEAQDLPWHMVLLAMWYNYALLAYEANIYGPLLKTILTGESTFSCPGAPYRNLYRRITQANKPYAYPKDDVGFWTTDITKLEGQALLSQRFQDWDRFDENGNLIYKGTDIWWDKLFEEARTYERRIDNHGQYEDSCPNARRGCHDDILRAFEIALKAEQQLYHKFFDVPSKDEPTKDDMWLLDKIKERDATTNIQLMALEDKILEAKTRLSEYEDKPLYGGE